MVSRTQKKNETVVSSPVVPTVIRSLFESMADQAPGILSIRSVGKHGVVRMRHEIAGRSGRRPYLERQNFSMSLLGHTLDGRPLVEVRMDGQQSVAVSAVPSAVLAVVRR